jgi:hypothetical protein
MVIYTKNDIFLDKTPVPKGWYARDWPSWPATIGLPP